VKSCPYDAIALSGPVGAKLDKPSAVIDLGVCTLCGACVEACKRYQAIVITRRTFKGQDIKKYSGIAILAEHRRGKLGSVVPEIIGAARELQKELSAPVCAVLVGNGVRKFTDELLSYGVDEVWMIDNPGIGDFDEDVHAELVSEILMEKKPEIFLGGGTVVGRSLLPRVAAKILTGLTADCTELSIDPATMLLRQTRPAFGGNIMATIMCDKFRPQMATVRPHVMQMPEKQAGRSGTTIRDTCEIEEDDVLVKVLEIVGDRQGQSVDIGGADLIVSGGRGMMAKENFAVLQELADELGGVVGASRSAVDAGWMPMDRQVGQTGKTVRPKIYIACGISGAIQHLVGMQDSDVIIAINRDKDAPIFKVAKYGVVGDVLTIVPAITNRLREMKSAGASK